MSKRPDSSIQSPSRVVRSLGQEKIFLFCEKGEVHMQWYLVFLIVVATIWSLGVFFGLLLPDKTSKRVLNWVAEVEHQPLWWLPVGLFSLFLFLYGLNKAVNIQVNWPVFVRSMMFLIGVFIPIVIRIILGRRRRNKSSESLGEEV